jgi:DNA-binding NarL/FixJ family response regulator
VDVLQQAAREAVSADPSSEPPGATPQASNTASPAGERSVQRESQTAVLLPPTPVVRPRKPPRRKPATLSKQRRWQLEMYQQVRRLSAEGRSQQEIVEHLHLHPHTVRKYLRMEQFVGEPP